MKYILTPLDFSEESINALRIAIQVAEKGKAKVILSHTIETPDYFDISSGLKESYKADLKEAVNNKIDKILSTENASTSIGSIHVEFGHPFTHIQELIKKKKIDLVVMGSKGVRNWEGQMIGSNTDKIVRHVKCPVLIVKENLDINEIKDIVFATDLQHTPKFITRSLKELQLLLGAQLHLLKVVTPGKWATEPEIRNQMEKFIKLHGFTNYSIRIYNDAEVEDGIVHYSGDIEAGMVAMASHSKVNLPSLIQDYRTTQRVVENCRHIVWTCGLGDGFH